MDIHTEQDSKGGSMDIHAEKRKITRVDYPIRAQAEYQGSLFQGEIINVSLNGLLFKSDEHMDVSARERVSMLIDWNDTENGLVSTIECIVARRAERILGLQFDVIDSDTLMLLRERLAAKAGDRINQEFIHFMIDSK